MRPLNVGENPPAVTFAVRTPMPKAIKAISRLVKGPANAMSAEPHSPPLTRSGLKGTGLAPPNIGAHTIASTSGKIIVRNGSMCLSGLSDIRPSRFAVSSPSQ